MRHAGDDHHVVCSMQRKIIVLHTLCVNNKYQSGRAMPTLINRWLHTSAAQNRLRIAQIMLLNRHRLRLDAKSPINVTSPQGPACAPCP